jgi:hypothetical protein
MNNKLRKSLIIVIIIAVFVIIGTLIYLNKKQEPANPTLVDFAKCLSSVGLKMYGAYWCSHCNNEKKMFEDSWQYINYVECTPPDGNGQTQACQDAGITGYPTWEFQDGEKVAGELSLEELSQESGCELKKQN